MATVEELPKSEDLKRMVREETDTLLLSFSCGKDSLALWLYLRDTFNLIPFFMYLIPDLRSDNEMLDYYERWFGQKIMRFPHPLLYKCLNNFTYQPPERIARIRALGLPNYEFADIDQVLYNHYGLENSYCAVGMRMKDNIDRRNMMLQKGVLGHGSRRFYYGVWDWDVNQIAGIIRENKVKISRLYPIMGRTIIAMDYQYMKPFRDAYPDDYEKICAWFPMIDMEFYRYEKIRA